jgi:hypothetical protein
MRFRLCSYASVIINLRIAFGIMPPALPLKTHAVGRWEAVCDEGGRLARRVHTYPRLAVYWKLTARTR